eukprot:NODE_1999_length_679_cov_148.252381_g1562_i0.p1 GENE.NODE_1999_length_679_cov_148.252381_g1562_i0~~NODE_1999_length_679_cov_148.252381_g1562_i0.p1  ORF type:complete len:183 (+),score=56.06 NODE_1999_length_679_cov_148.252381_g1562_i0:70-618(+)
MPPKFNKSKQSAKLGGKLKPKSKKEEDSDEDLDAMLEAFQKTKVAVAPALVQATKAERRNRRKELEKSKEPDVPDQKCPACKTDTLKLTRILPQSNYDRGAYTCNLCMKFGNAHNTVWHCPQCDYDAHPTCMVKKLREDNPGITYDAEGRVKTEDSAEEPESTQPEPEATPSAPEEPSELLD